MRSLSAWFPAALTALLLTGCGLLPGASADLEGAWQLRDGTVDGRAIPMEIGRLVTLDIEGSTVRGRSACNLYSGTISVRDDHVSIGQLGGTEMGCDPDVMAVEATFLAALARVERGDRAGEELTLRGGGVELRFGRVAPTPDASLTGTRWTLESLISGETVSSVRGEGELVLGSDGTLAGNTGCRGFSARYQRSGEQLTLSGLMTDMRPCSTDVAAQDGQVLAVLESRPTLAIEGDRLVLSGGGDRGLAYRSAGTISPPPSSGGSAAAGASSGGAAFSRR